MKKLLLILLFVATAAQAETYKWIDGEGTVHFSDSPGEVPAKYRNSAKPHERDSTRDGNNELKTNPENTWSEPRQGAGDRTVVPPQVEGLKERMMKDEGIMTIIRTLQDDPEMRALLSDPATMSAIQAGDIGKLMNNPAFMKLLNDPRVREIEKKLNTRNSE